MGRDLLIGGAGNDDVHGHRGDDRLLGGGGFDVLGGASAMTSVGPEHVRVHTTAASGSHASTH